MIANLSCEHEMTALIYQLESEAVFKHFIECCFTVGVHWTFGVNDRRELEMYKQSTIKLF